MPLIPTHSARVQRRTRVRTARHGSRGPFDSNISPWLLVAIAVVALVLLALAVQALGNRNHALAADQPKTVLIHTPPDANTTETVIPNEMREALSTIARSHGSVLLIRAEGDGTVTTSTTDLTPRTAKGEVLQVPDRIDAAIDDSIAALEAEMNRPSPNTKSRALHQGLLQARIPADAEVWVLSSGIDLEPPIDTRDLAWDVPVDDVLTVVNQAGAVPDLSGAHVTFVMNSPTGEQQIRSPQTAYLHSLWSGLLRGGGAASVEFIDMPPGEPASDQAVAVVDLPPLPSTPVSVQADVADPDAYSCTLQTSAGFVPDTDRLVDEAAVRAALADCVARMVPGSTVRLDGHTAYYGPLDANGKPTTTTGAALSQRRCDRITSLLVSMGVPAEAITASVGHGSADQPDPANPTSQSNRVVIVTVTPPAK